MCVSVQHLRGDGRFSCIRLSTHAIVSQKLASNFACIIGITEEKPESGFAAVFSQDSTEAQMLTNLPEQVLSYDSQKSVGERSQKVSNTIASSYQTYSKCTSLRGLLKILDDCVFPAVCGIEDVRESGDIPCQCLPGKTLFSETENPS